MFSLENYHRFSHTHRRASRLKSRNLFNIRFFLWVFLGVFLEGKHLTRYILHESEE